MAKAATKPASRRKAEANADTLDVRLVVDLPADTPTYYANHVEIAVNKHEISLWIARLPTKPAREQMALAQETGELLVEAEMQILMPPTLIDGLIGALETTKLKYEKAFGPIREIKE
jgi:hypothetical protein